MLYMSKFHVHPATRFPIETIQVQILYLVNFSNFVTYIYKQNSLYIDEIQKLFVHFVYFLLSVIS